MQNPYDIDSSITSNETDVEKNVASLKNELIELKELVNKIQIQSLSKELQLSEDIIQNSGEFHSIRRMKRGVGSIPVLESEIKEAQEKTITAADAARYLRLSYITYKKYATLYGLWKTNINYKKEGRIVNAEKEKISTFTTYYW